MSELDVGVTAAIAVVTAVTARRSPPTAFAVVLASLLLASASIGEVKEVFLTARWGALVTLPLVLLWPLPRRLHELTLELVALGIAAVLALSATWSIDPELTLMRAASFGFLLLAVARLVNLSGRAWNPRRFVDAIAVVGLLVGVSSLLLWVVRPDIAVYVGELRGVLENQNGLGLFLGLTYPFVLAAADRRLGRRLWTVSLLAPFALVIGLSESRSGALALLVGLTAYELAIRFPARLLLNLLVGVVGVLAVSLLLGSLGGAAPAPVVPTPAPGSAPGSAPAVPTQRPAERPDILGRGGAVGPGQLQALLGARNEAWNATAELILDRPLLGYGFGTGDQVFARYPERADFVFFQGANPNSGYLQALLELGFPFSLLILVPLSYALVASAGAAVRVRFTVERAAFMACLLGGLAAGGFESLFTAAGAPWAFLLWLSAGALLPIGAVRRRAAEAERSAGAQTAQSTRIPTFVESWEPAPEVAIAAASGRAELLGPQTVASSEGASSVIDRPRPLAPQVPARSGRRNPWLFASVVAAALVVALGALALYAFGLRDDEPRRQPVAHPEQPKAMAFAQQVAAARCPRAGCAVAELTSVSPGLWRFRLVGGENACFLLDVGRFVVSSRATPEGLAEIQCATVPLRNRNVLTVAGPAIPPAVGLSSDPRLRLQGDVVQEVARRLGIPEVRWRRTAPDRFAATATRYDLAIATLPGGVSDAALGTSRPFFTEDAAVFASPDEAPATAAQVAATRIAVGDGLALRVVSTRFPDALVTGYPVPDAALRDVVAGNAGVAAVSVPTALSIASAFPRLELVGRLRGIDPNVFLAEPGSPVLDAVDKALAAMARDGTLARIQERWFPGSTTLALLE